MALVTTDSVKSLQLQYALGAASAPSTLTLHLYSSNTTPTGSSTTASFTECSFAGYSSVSLAAASWGSPSVSGGVSTSVYPTQTFTLTSAGTTNIYGYYITNSGGTLQWAELFSSVKTLSNAYDSLSFNPTYSSSN